VIANVSYMCICIYVNVCLSINDYELLVVVKYRIMDFLYSVKKNNVTTKVT